MPLVLPLKLRERLRRLTPMAWRARNMRRFLPRPSAVLGLAPPGPPLHKRALLAYKTASFRLTHDDPERLNFSHQGLGPAIVAALNSLGYVVDVIDYQHPDPHVDGTYDLFVGHMNFNFVRVARQLSPTVPRIYLATTLPWQLNNRLERERLRGLRDRRGVLLPEERIIYFNEEPAYRAATGIICTGNELSRTAYAPACHVHPVRNAARHEPRDVPSTKNFSEARRHFLFFAGPGSVHKGLDLLLEIFPLLAKDGLHLHVCQYLDPRFIAVYNRELLHSSNIHVHGNVTPRSAEYYQIVDRCAFLVSPSCAEGGQGAVVEAMHQGLVPILSRECTVDVTPAGFCIANCILPVLASTIQEAAALTPDEVRARAHATQHEARTRYTEKAFITDFGQAVAAILRAGKA
jgi:glycosyltransferase involved in cell wall biosynthesis